MRSRVFWAFVMANDECGNLNDDFLDRLVGLVYSYRISCVKNWALEKG